MAVNELPMTKQALKDMLDAVFLGQSTRYALTAFYSPGANVSDWLSNEPDTAVIATALRNTADIVQNPPSPAPQSMLAGPGSGPVG